MRFWRGLGPGGYGIVVDLYRLIDERHLPRRRFRSGNVFFMFADISLLRRSGVCPSPMRAQKGQVDLLDT